ncbi:hypothetical protein CONPUDRAFT_114464 [Coniophora puteana RWD-64-598 SS2]|uniref:Uncharacterized protein n=1 Tax=Coniophora puteana (strain RWD-64-598) TaxID=741705 RepID=A0A5M3N605_CONPW|nr:uncharacterized protein CONPUDRAFT_114464 [Coniophora puteana RWD-64-598 SS2]EIW86285.1 hypothetical protein CONPUDRAFT_114464 [Coniophora puteana RWD-64-598 SS2]
MFSLASLRSSLLRSTSTTSSTAPSGIKVGAFNAANALGARFAGQLAPKHVLYAKRHKGRVPVPIGGSIKGTTLAYGEWGIRIKGHGVRLTAKQLSTAQDVIKRKIKAIKGSKCFMRVFPDIPVCIKGSETRMGKGKGTFEYWATWVPTGRVIFEVGGVPIREEIAREALRQASDKLPTKMEFIARQTPPRLGRLLITPETPIVPPSSAVKRTVETPQPA